MQNKVKTLNYAKYNYRSFNKNDLNRGQYYCHRISKKLIPVDCMHLKTFVLFK